MPADHPAFRLSMQAAGLVPPPRLIADGNPHHFYGGSYALSRDGRWGACRVNGSGWLGWSALEDTEQAAQLRREERAQLETEEKRLRVAAAWKAAEMWREAKEGSHPYLDKKGICSNGSRVLGELLLVPVRDFAGRLHSIQTISADGTKLFLKGGAIAGHCHWIRRGQEDGPTLYLAEGFSTSSTIHCATGGRPVLVCFTCTNLQPVAEELRRRRPRARIVIACDNDHLTPNNPGISCGTEAAKAIRARLAIPTGMRGSDFNDLMQERGIDEVKRQLATTRKP